MRGLWTIMTIVLLSGIFGITQAQDELETNPWEPTLVSIEAADGKLLHGAYFAPHADAPAVLVIHQLYSNRHSWNDLIQPMMEAGFNVLAIDLRGHGRTRGAINWTRTQDDIQLWAAWLLEQPSARSVSMVGSSMGSVLALDGCATFEGCRAAVALSPALDYFRVDATEAYMADYPKLVIYAERDRYPALDMPTIAEIAVNTAFVAYPGNAHGVALFDVDETLIPTIIAWLRDRA